jgi:hypothetical protein
MDIGCLGSVNGKKQVEVYAIGGLSFGLLIIFRYWNLKIGLFTKLPNICESKTYLYVLTKC